LFEGFFPEGLAPWNKSKPAPPAETDGVPSSAPRSSQAPAAGDDEPVPRPEPDRVEEFDEEEDENEEEEPAVPVPAARAAARRLPPARISKGVPQWAPDSFQSHAAGFGPRAPELEPDGVHEHENEFKFGDADPDPEPAPRLPEDYDISDVIQFAAGDAGPKTKRSILTVLPILTDQGAALAAFVKHFNLNWKLCIRHILEAVGTKDPIFSWVLRLIYAWCPEEYVHECLTIAVELAGIGLEPRKAKLLQLMMGRVHVAHPLRCLSRWAAFARQAGVPRTANQIEGRHSHLNRETKGLKDLVDLLFQLIVHCQKAYRNRNANLRISFQKNKRLFSPDQDAQEDVSFNPAKCEYYRALYTLRGQKGRNGPDPNAELEPDLETYGFAAEFTEKKVDVVLPPKWQPKPTVSTNEVPERQTLHAAGSRTKRDQLTYEIMAEMRRLFGESLSAVDTSVFAEIARLGEHLPEFPRGGYYDPKDEGGWRLQSREYVEQLLAPPAPKEAAPQRAARQKAAPQKAAPQKAAPQKAAPQKAAPQKAAPKRAAPGLAKSKSSH
jgi:hypothetical protein